MEDENAVNTVQPKSIHRSRIPQSSGLNEMNQSSTNARSGLLPPGTIAASVANKSSGISQPTKTKTASQQPAEPKKSGLAASTNSRPASGAAKPHGRANSVASSVSSRTTSTSSRTSSNGSSSATVGPGARPPSVLGIPRAQTSQSGLRKPGALSVPRPKTSLDTHEEESSGSVLGKRKAWDHESRVREFEQMAESFFARMSQAGHESYGLKETVELYKSRVSELEATQKELRETNVALRVEIETMKNRVAAAENALKDAQREHEIAVDEFDRRQRVEAENIRQEGKKELEALRSRHEEEIRELTRASEEEMRELKRRYESELEDERAARHREINQLASERALDSQRTRIELENKDREISRLQADLQALRDDLEQERAKNRDLRQNLDTASSNSVTLESTIRALKARIEFLESDSQEQSQAFERLNQQLMDALAETNAAKEKLRREETLRRKLHNQVQELKGNIRVFCRVRPTLPHEASEAAQIQFPDESSDCKEISVLGPEERSSLGNVTRKNHVFSFDRVFGPNTNNADVFEEISQLVQSALDGYNVCIFCYGQTGSGKTYTMSSEDGMIPRAVHQIYDTAKNLEEKGWKYTMEGNFVEVYNENLNDLLGKAEEFDKKKHEIRHDMQRCRTTITDVTTVTLDSPQTVESILRRAAANRSVAATKANERSSRSHSVFILRLIGENSITGERSEGTLNLVDLAGSERLSHSGATGERLKETQNINRSLACLGDVISALGQGKEGGHIPYRNSKLTYLLQFSLGGNSKTLMFVMVSPLQAHLGETLTSLKFATKVHNTHIGTAKRQARIRDS